MPFKDENVKRQRQKQLKTVERAQTKELLHALDMLVPFRERNDRALNGVLKSKRSNLHLLEDLREALKSAQESTRGVRAFRIPAGLLREGMLSSRSERLVVVEMPGWRVVDVSCKMQADFDSGLMFGQVRGQCLLHFIDERDRHKLHELSRHANGRRRSKKAVEMGVKMRFFSPNSIVHRACTLKMWQDGRDGKMVVWVEGSSAVIEAEDWHSRDLTSLRGVLHFDSELSRSTPWHIDRAMRFLVKSHTGLLTRLVPVLESSDSSSSVLEKMAKYTGSTLDNLTSALGRMVMLHAEVHLTIELDHHTHLPVAHVHARIRLPHVLGAFRTPWKKLLRASTQDDFGPSLCDASQIVRFIPSVDEETNEFCFLAYFIRREDMVCFHSRKLQFNDKRMEQSGQVFADAWEAPYSFSYTMSRTGEEADRVLLAQLAEESGDHTDWM
uniref:Uncharacterized protein n=1 Tax=Guillardia theta TaxID=55529 RepID=A0A7S4L309_GUITH|mmetsp:Transcript_36408/g.113454  ORF Transcript_36408/g.113454 Transcript_36408/m.113454 type:complete len:441 (+) Transcript_36408:267-1589(+)